MASPAIILRFRDTTPDVDTIAEHRALLAKQGQVGWGWWKKAVEPVEFEKIVRLISDRGEIGVVLIDRSTRRAYICACSGFDKPLAADTLKVPQYYRDHLSETAGVFTMRSIDDIDYDVAVSDAIADQTFLWIGTRADPKLGHVATAARAPGRSCVLHLSDLHFGADYGFRLQREDVEIGDRRRTLTDCIVADLERLRLKDEIAAVIVTGDFVTHGVWSSPNKGDVLAEFEALRKHLRLEKDQIIALPGNHDVVRYPHDANVDLRENAVARQTNTDYELPFRTFVDELIGRDWKASLNYVRRFHLGEADLDICVLNSCTIAASKWTEYGYVGRSGLDTIVELKGQQVERPTLRFLALHHHLLPVSDVEAPNWKGVTLTLDASDILAAAQQSCVHVILHGHQHKPKVTTYHNLPLHGEPAGGPVHIVANGSAGAKNGRLPAGERNTYCLFRLGATEIDLWIRELRLDAALGAELFHGPLPISPIHA
jgi:predicted phosphodiesterase